MQSIRFVYCVHYIRLYKVHCPLHIEMGKRNNKINIAFGIVLVINSIYQNIMLISTVGLIIKTKN